MQRKLLPEALRVKSFVISFEDIKLDKGILTSTIEIEKVHTAHKNQDGSDDDSDEYKFERTEFEQSESDISKVGMRA